MNASLFASFSRWEKALFLLPALLLVGCTPKIGDGCVLSTDCSQQGDRLCDTSQPGGYCTIFNCTDLSCPDKAVCVMFESSVPGCSYTDRGIPRTGRSFCVAHCNTNSDCRQGYVCVDPRTPPWDGIILDDWQGQLACLVAASYPPDASTESDPSAQVCQASGPDDAGMIDAAPPPTLDAGAVESDAAAEAGTTTDAGLDAGTTDAGLDAGADASDSGM